MALEVEEGFVIKEGSVAGRDHSHSAPLKCAMMCEKINTDLQIQAGNGTPGFGKEVRCPTEPMNEERDI